MLIYCWTTSLLSLSEYMSIMWVHTRVDFDKTPPWSASSHEQPLTTRWSVVWSGPLYWISKADTQWVWDIYSKRHSLSETCLHSPSSLVHAFSVFGAPSAEAPSVGRRDEAMLPELHSSWILPKPLWRCKLQKRMLYSCVHNIMMHAYVPLSIPSGAAMSVILVHAKCLKLKVETAALALSSYVIHRHTQNFKQFFTNALLLEVVFVCLVSSSPLGCIQAID